jgi:hypothetical protein
MWKIVFLKPEPRQGQEEKAGRSVTSFTALLKQALTEFAPSSSIICTALSFHFLSFNLHSDHILLFTLHSRQVCT